MWSFGCRDVHTYIIQVARIKVTCLIICITVFWLLLIRLTRNCKNLDPFSAPSDFGLKRAKILTWKQCWNNFLKYSEIFFAHSRTVPVSLLFMTSLSCLLSFFLRYWNRRIMLEATTTLREGNGTGCYPSSPWVGMEPTPVHSWKLFEHECVKLACNTLPRIRKSCCKWILKRRVRPNL